MGQQPARQSDVSSAEERLVLADGMSIRYDDMRDVSPRVKHINRQQVQRTIDRVVTELGASVRPFLKEVALESSVPLLVDEQFFLWYIQDKGIVYPAIVRYKPMGHEESGAYIPDDKKIVLYGTWTWPQLNTILLHEFAHGIATRLRGNQRSELRSAFTEVQGEIREKIADGYALSAAVAFVGMPQVYSCFSVAKPLMGNEVFLCRRAVASERKTASYGWLEEAVPLTKEEAERHRERLSVILIRRFSVFRTRFEEAFADSFALLFSPARAQVLAYGGRRRVLNESAAAWYQIVGGILEEQYGFNPAAGLDGRMRTR